VCDVREAPPGHAAWQSARSRSRVAWRRCIRSLTTRREALVLRGIAHLLVSGLHQWMDGNHKGQRRIETAEHCLAALSVSQAHEVKALLSSAQARGLAVDLGCVHCVLCVLSTQHA